MNILGLDTATKTGWALMSNGRLIESGVMDFSKRRGEGNGIVFLRFRKWLHGMVAAAEMGGPDIIAYEQAHFRGAGTELLVGLQTRCQEVAAEVGIESIGVHTGTLKKWATGKGNAGKGDMIKEAEKVLGRAPQDDNEADAVLIASWAYNSLIRI